MLRLEEYFGVIIRTEAFFEDGDTTPRISVEFIDGIKRIEFKGSTSEIESMLSYIQDEVVKASDREYIP